MSESVTAQDDATSLPSFPPPRTDLFSLPEQYDEVRGCPGLARVDVLGKPAWLATRYDDVRTVCSHAAFSADTSRDGYPQIFAGRTSASESSPTFIHLDPPDHDTQRRMLTPFFRAKDAHAMRDRMQHLVDGYLDEMLLKGPPADLVADFALRLPTWVICTLLGVPEEDHEFFQTRTVLRLSRTTPPELMAQVTRELDEFLARIIDERAAAPGDDMISQLVRTQVATGKLTREQLLGMARLLLVAGHETSANGITLGTLLLLRNPDQLELLREDPSRWRNAIEEIMRVLTPTQFNVRRTATEDVEVGGTTVRAGDGVIALVAAANRDPEVFVDPDAFDVERDTHRHIAFGFGVHQCLGQNFARMELDVALRSLFARIPDLRLAVPYEELQTKVDSVVLGLHELPLTWGGA